MYAWQKNELTCYGFFVRRINVLFYQVAIMTHDTGEDTGEESGSKVRSIKNNHVF